MRVVIVVVMAAIVVGCGGDSASPRAPRAPSPSQRGAYIGDVGALIRDPIARARLIESVHAGRMNVIIPYRMAALLAGARERAVLATWIGELHRAGAQVVAPIAGADRLRALADLIDEHPEVWFDGLVTEHEYWNRSDRDAALVDLLDLLAAMRAQAAAWTGAPRAIAVGAYLGYPTASEARRLAAAVDFVYLDYSVTSPARAWHHIHVRGGALRQRLAWFAGAGVAVWPIFYATGEVDMRATLVTDGIAAAEDRFRADQAADRELGRRPVAGFVYFTFEALTAYGFGAGPQSMPVTEPL